MRLLCRVLQVKSSSYYTWKSQRASVIETEEFALCVGMKELFAQSRESLGSRRVQKKLQAQGLTIGRYRVRKLMKRLGLKVKLKYRYKATTDSKHNLPVAENKLNRNFNPTEPNQVWTTDITYVWTIQGWLYLAAVMDLYARRIVGWCIDTRMTKELTLRALAMAVHLRQPDSGLMHHSDRGSQYASEAYQDALEKHQMICSMSRKGNRWDNAVTERFFRSLKTEWIGDQIYQTRQQAIQDVNEYMQYYDSVRLHSTLGYQTPMEYENILSKVSGFA